MRAEKFPRHGALSGLFLLAALFGCSADSPRGPEPASPAGAPGTPWIEITSIAWQDTAGVGREMLPPVSRASLALPWSEAYRRSLAEGTTASASLPRIKFRSAREGTTSRSGVHRLYFRPAGKDSPPTFEASLPLAVAEDGSGEIALTADVLSRAALAQPGEWRHEIRLAVEGSGGRAETSLAFHVEDNPRAVPLKATLFHHASRDAARRDELQSAPVESETAWGELLARSPRAGKGRPFARLEIVSAESAAVPEAIECRARATGELEYTRPYRRFAPRGRDGGLLVYSVPLGLETLGDLAFLADARSRFAITCRRGDSTRFTMSFSLAWIDE